ncbi:uncharacterized protein F4822DRAFT_417591 [Hypoxylon trugodes]|uniref:uncharacterized protein n=1 Tax=Hypoxylon trugodes TaxID=326681 RepID=UPI00218D52A5|nr:uncharacterized protein F4822DRAFT_417591 [Hypoxylon trugodes]KAI1383780.1 hypothetical protein F4822DRAFT_417591 [Hypoxylon trugodes]
MSAADYYGNGGGGYSQPQNQGYPSQPQYAQSPSHSPYPQQPNYAGGPPSQSPYPSQPTYAQSPAPQSQNYLAPYQPQQQQYSRPGSAHSDVGYPPPAYSADNQHSSAAGSPYPRPHSADPYASQEDRDPNRQHAQEGEDGERGLGATLLGGGAGGLLGHKLGKGKLGTILGSAVGAVAANMVEHKLQGRNSNQNQGHGHGHHGHHAPPSDGGYYYGAPQGHHHSHGHHGHHHSHHSHHSQGW